jgi:hypothetical protein
MASFTGMEMSIYDRKRAWREWPEMSNVTATATVRSAVMIIVCYTHKVWDHS